MIIQGDIRLAFIAVLAFYFVLLSNTFAATESNLGTPIADLQRKVFRITTTNGTQTMSLITGYSGEPWSQKWWTEGYAKPCIDNIAKLNRTEAASVIKGNHQILAFLDCPAANDGGADSIVALFDSAATDAPLCFRRVELMDKPRYHYWGMARSLEVRKLPDDTLIVVPTLSGGDAGDSWVSHVVLHMDKNCNVTLLSRFYASMSHDVDDSGRCEGEEQAYKFVDDTTIEIKKNRIQCTKSGKHAVPIMTNRLNLNDLLYKPKLRIFEP